MKRAARLALVLASLFAARPAVAGSPPDKAAPWSGADWAAGTLAAAGGALVLGTGSAFLGAAIGAASCREPDGLGCLASASGGALIGTILGVTAGASLGSYLYGEATGHRGSLGPALGGAAGGLLVGGGVALLGCQSDDACVPLAVGGLVLFPALGAALGYGLSVDERGSSAALSRHDPRRGFTLGAPAVQVTNVAGERAVTLRLAAGTF